MKKYDLIKNILIIIMILSFIMSKGIYSVIRYLEFYDHSMRAMIFFVCSNIIYISALFFISILYFEKQNIIEFKWLGIIFILHLLLRSEIVTHLSLLVFFSKYIKNKNIIIISYFIFQLSILLFALLAKPYGIDPNGLGRQGVYLGFTNINVSIMHIYSLILSIIFVFRNKRLLPMIVLIILIIVFLLTEYTGSRTIILASTALVPLLVPIKYYRRFDSVADKTKLFVIIMPLILFVFTLLMSILFSEGDLNSFTSTRLNLIRTYLKNIDNFIFGMETLFTKAYYPYPLDNGYVHIFYQSGIIGILTMTLALAFLIKQMYNTKQYVYIFITLSFLLYNLTEKAWDTNYNFIIIIAMCMMKYSNRKVSNENEK